MNQKKRNSKSGGANGPIQQRILATKRALRGLVKDLYLQQYGPGETPAAQRFSIEFEVDPNQDWALNVAQDLEAQLKPQLESMEAARAVFKYGKLFCFRCKENNCDHAQPSEPAQVFVGYDSMGCPNYEDLSQYLINTGDPDVDSIYEHRPKLLVRHIPGRVLRERQVASFGRTSKSYAILHQTLAGYFVIPGREAFEDAGKLALSFQAVEGRSRDGKFCLELNTLFSRGQFEDELKDAIDEHLGWVNRARKNSLSELKRLESRIHRGESRDILRAVPGIMRRFGQVLERNQRQQSRQTRHAQERKQIQRPVDKAMADLREARPERMYLDARTKAIVLCADKGRCHIFSELGRHVTSFTINTESVRTRLRKKRWLSLEPGMLEQFMKQVSAQ